MRWVSIGCQTLAGNHHVEIVEIAFGDFVLVVLVQHLAEHRAIAQRLPPDIEAQILGCLALNFVDDADAQADGPDWIGRTQDGREAADHRGCGRPHQRPYP